MNPTSLAAAYGTPAYAYDLAAVRAAHADLRAMLPEPSTVYYSLKANPHPRIVEQLHRLNARAEVSSVGEIDAALAGGVPAQEILLTAPGKSDATIAYALRHGVRRMSVDSPTDLERVGRGAESVRCLLRVNADRPIGGAGLAMTGTASQFGADLSWVLREPEMFGKSGRAEVDGLHVYMATNLLDEDSLVAQFDTAAEAAEMLADAFGGLAEIDLGGGFGAPYARAGLRSTWPTLKQRVEAILDRRLPGWRDGTPSISFEFGRYLVGDCGILICRVLDVKRSKGQTFVVLDSGINHLGGMAGLRRLPPIVPTVVQVAAEAGHDAVATIVGPLCTPLDSMLRNATLPPMHPGDLVVVPNIGAYGLTASLLGFLGHPAPIEIVCDGDAILDASRLTITREGVR